MSDQRNLILAIVLSVGIILGFQYFYELPRLRQAQQQAALQQAQQAQVLETAPGTVTPGPARPGAPAGEAGAGSRPQVLARSARVPIDNGRLHGSIALTGGRLDDMTLADYREAVDPASPEIVLLSPAGAPGAYFVEHGWVAATPGVALPDARTEWRLAEGERLTPTTPVVLAWDNGQGLLFERRFEIDQDFMVTVTQTVTNRGDLALSLFPYGLVSRWGTPPLIGFYILHEGLIGVLGETLHEVGYDSLRDDGAASFTSRGGWLGFTDKYWLTALVPDQASEIKADFRHTQAAGQDRYQADYLGPGQTVAPGAAITTSSRVFVGAKELDRLDLYEARYELPLFDYAVDFGWFFFLTKPIFYTLTFLYKFTGNYGVAILILTLIVKLLFFPLANKSYAAMSRMKKLQPKMLELRERFGDDRARMNQEMMALYKREKVNPVAGCLPILVQIPVFFALYKVLFVSIEMRHAPFFGWIQDLSAPDPTSIFNLFGLIPWDPPQFLMIGVWPLIMGFTMFLQTRLNPQPADPIQARVMNLLPLMFIFLFATFPAGLVIYWAWNNILSVGQQWLIMRRVDAEPAPAKT
jgi:YidC/Oxa1 family membrane protein insertase